MNSFIEKIKTDPGYQALVLGGFVAILLSPALIVLARLGVHISPSLQILNLRFSLYGLVIAIAVMVVAELARKVLQRVYGDVVQEVYWKILAGTLLAGVLGARVWHVVSDWNQLYVDEPVRAFYIWDGGLALFGGVIAGGGALSLLLRYYKLPVLQTINTAVVFLPLGQIIGRLGNYLNQELFGGPTNLPWGLHVDPANRPEVYIGNDFFHPAFWYEQLFLFGLLILLVYLHKARRGADGAGTAFHCVCHHLLSVYLVGYGVVRLLLEQVRLDPDWIGGLSFGEVWAVVITLVGLGGILISNLLARRNGKT